jgi:DNA-binding helix-hairpin-helix protein with protein kinase domain
MLVGIWMGARTISPLAGERSRRQEAVRQKQSALKVKQETWQRLAREATSRFVSTKRGLEQKRREYEGLEAAYLREAAALYANRRESQLHTYLDRFFIDQASLPGIGPGLKAVLVSYGIETAADVNPFDVDDVPGFGPRRTAELLAWRNRVEQGFRYDPSKGVDPRDSAALKRKYDQARRDLEQALSAGAQALQLARTAPEQSLRSARLDIEALLPDLAQAEADAKAAGWF